LALNLGKFDEQAVDDFIDTLDIEGILKHFGLVTPNSSTPIREGVMDNTAKARFLISLGSLNGYSSTVAQTQRALERDSSHLLNQSGDDVAIFEDTLRGIDAIKQIGFSVDGIIAVNAQFNTPSDEQPIWPGHLRNAHDNEDDRISLTLDSQTREAYFPPDQITREDLQAVVDKFEKSAQKEVDAWKVFADLSKLQPFQDGNKRTALIAANAAYGALETEDYLVLPFGDLDRAEFMILLMRYYITDNSSDSQTYFDRMMHLLPMNRKAELRRPIKSDTQGKTSATHVKPQFRSPKRDRD